MAWVFLAGSFCKTFIFHDEIYTWGILSAALTITAMRDIEPERKRGRRHEI